MARQRMGMVSKAGELQGWAPVANSSLGVHRMENNGVKLGVGGTFARINGQLRASFARFSPAPFPAPEACPATEGNPVPGLAQQVRKHGLCLCRSPVRSL